MKQQIPIMRGIVNHKAHTCVHRLQGSRQIHNKLPQFTMPKLITCLHHNLIVQFGSLFTAARCLSRLATLPPNTECRQLQSLIPFKKQGLIVVPQRIDPQILHVELEESHSP